MDHPDTSGTEDLQARHRLEVARVAEAVRAFREAGQPARIRHGSTNSTRSRDPGERCIDISGMNRVLRVDAEAREVIAEPNVPMDALVDATLRHGLVPPVVMEFPGITVGGGIQGGAGESSSFREGLFHESCLECELVLGDGEILTVSPTRRADLFHGSACAMGTLGVLTLAKLRLVPATRYVRLTYRRVGGPAEILEALREASRGGADFLDAILFDRSFGVVMEGLRTDEPWGKVRTFSRATDEHFYLHARRAGAGPRPLTETVPLREYLFRYDRGAFWGAAVALRRAHLPFNRLTRFLFHPAFKTRRMYRALHSSNVAQQFIVQDITLPEGSASAFLDFVDRELGIRPLWLCPLKPDPFAPLSPTHLDTGMAVNVGVYGALRGGARDYATLVAANRGIEAEARRLGGRKILYAHTYATREEFWETYPEGWYRGLRGASSAAPAFPDLHEKAVVRERYESDLKTWLAAAALRAAKRALFG